MVNWSDIFAGEGAGEEVLGECIQHVFPRNISCIFSDTVRIGRDQEICVLHAAQPLHAAQEGGRERGGGGKGGREGRRVGGR